MERVDAGRREEPEGTGQGSRPGDDAAGGQRDMFGAAFFAAIVPMTISSLLDGRLIEINDAACEMLDVERATSIGTLAEDAGFFVDLADRDAVVRELQENRAVRNREFPFRRKNGQLAYGSIQATVIDVGGEPCILAEMSDITSRRSTEEALRASEARFATAFNSAGVMMLIVRALDGTIVDANRAFLRATGYDRDAVVGKTSDELPLFVDPADRGRLVLGLRQNGRVHDLETRVAGRTGAAIDALLSADPIMLEGVPHVITTVIDTTERKRADEALRASEARYRNLVEQTADGVLLLDMEGRIAETNQAMADLLGRPVEELPGTLWTDYMEPANLAEMPFQRPELDLGHPVVFERRLLRPDGSVVEMEIHARHIAPDLMLGTAREIGARKAAERERARLIQAIEQSGESIIITDPTTSIVYVNPAFEKETGLSREEVLGRNRGAIMATDDGRAIYREALDAVATEGTWSGEVRTPTKDGRVLREAVRVSAVRDSSGAIVNYVSMQRNVTRERELEDQLRQAQKMEAVGRLAGGVAHDFNNLLTAISGFAELASAEAPSGSDLGGYVDEIRASAERATILTRQLLAFGRRTVLQPKVLDINKVVTDVAPMLRRIIGENIRLEVTADPQVGRTLADRGQLEQVVVNLAVNARDAMPGGGKLTIVTENATGEATSSSGRPKVRSINYVRMSISDTGVGMDAETAEHIFEPFFTTKNPGGGTGLGLATVFGIVRQSGGQISVRSAPGEGATFCIDLPAISSEPDETPAPSRDGVAPPGRETVLIVEDEPAVLRFASRLLERSGYTVLQAANGDEAVDLARKYTGRIDLIFSDLVMPGLTGHETAAAVTTARQETRQLFASGYSEEMNARRGVEAAAHRFVAKPYAAEALLRAIREALADDRG